MVNTMEDDNEDENDAQNGQPKEPVLRVNNLIPNDDLGLHSMELYQNTDSEADPVYKKFLYQIYSEEVGNETNTDDNDPEYVFNNDIFSHGWSFDLNEVKEIEVGGRSAALVKQEDGQLAAPGTSVSPDSRPHQLQANRRHIDVFADPKLQRVLNQQFRQHIQLLTQTYILTKDTMNMQSYAEDAKRHLQSYLKIFGNRPKPSNLLPALQLTKKSTAGELKSSTRYYWRQLKLPESIERTIHDHPNIFIYANLLPQATYSTQVDRNTKQPKSRIRTEFTPGEDKLLAQALHQFRGEKLKYELIASLLMTVKTKKQLIDRVKNARKEKSSPNPIKQYYDNDETNLPEVNHDLDPVVCDRSNSVEQTFEIMDMDLDDLVAASSTISKPTHSYINNSENKYIKNLKLRKSMLNLMSHNFIFSEQMGNLMIDEFMNFAQQKLGERHYLHLLQLLSDLVKKKDVTLIYHEIIEFLTKIGAPQELHERVVLFLDMEQASKCGCAMSYLHWMRFFEFMQHLELYHDSVDVIEKKLLRLIDALQKDDPHKIKLAITNIVNKHPFLMRQFESLCLDTKPHQSLFICEENFDDVTEPLSSFEPRNNDSQTSPVQPPNRQLNDAYKFEHFSSKVSKEELSYASQHCPCKCHAETTNDGQPGQHCGRCNLKFMRGRMYLVNKIKPILAEWSYIEPVEVKWTFEEDREILEFCRCKAERSEESITFDASTFEELANSGTGGATKKTACEIAKRFNDLMDIYKDSIGLQ